MRSNTARRKIKSINCLRWQPTWFGDRRIGVLIPFREDAETEALVVAFRQRFQELGWTQGRNAQCDYRYTDGNPERTRNASAELVALAPDAILAYANPAVASLMQMTHTIPIIFTQASDPVGSGFVSNSAHPGGRVMSAFGTKRTSRSCSTMSAFGGKEDIAQTSENVCF